MRSEEDIRGVKMSMVTGCDDSGDGYVVKPDVLGGVDNLMSSTKSDKPGYGIARHERGERSFMSSTHVVVRKPDQSSEAGGANLQSKIDSI